MEIRSHAELVEALGGYRAVAAGLGVSPQVISTYKARGFPPKWHMALTLLAREKGIPLADTFWTWSKGESYEARRRKKAAARQAAGSSPP
jgi:hypothetical protein